MDNAPSTLLTFSQGYRETLLARDDTVTARKTARIVAVQLFEPFRVETDRGMMAGQPGDWLVTNHPDDDAGSDLWTISSARMRETYELVERELT